MKSTGSVITVSVLLAMAVLIAGCAGTSGLGTSSISDEGSIDGTFDVVYYSDELGKEPGSMAVLDVAGDNYTIIPYAPESAYRVETGVPAPEAIAGAKAFLAKNPFYAGVSYRAIYAVGGEIAGYQVTPEYEAFTRISRAIHAHYFLEDGGIIRVRVPELSPAERSRPFMMFRGRD